MTILCYNIKKKEREHLMETEIYEKCKQLITKNVKHAINEDTLEILITSILTLMLKNPQRTLEKMPSILQELNILADERSVLDIAHEELNNYQEDDFLKYGDACVTRSLSINEETDEIQEQRSLLISLKSKNAVTLVQKTTHELTHLLRFKGIERKEDCINIKDGISINRFNLNTKSLKRKHYNLEEGIVEKYTEETVTDLYHFLIDNHALIETHPFLKRYVTEFPVAAELTRYPLQTNLLSILCDNKNFEQALNASFDEDITPSSVATYYNSIMDSPSAFSRLSKKVDVIINQMQQNKMTSETEEMLRDIQRDSSIFLIKSKTKGH